MATSLIRCTLARTRRRISSRPFMSFSHGRSRVIGEENCSKQNAEVRTDPLWRWNYGNAVNARWRRHHLAWFYATPSHSKSNATAIRWRSSFCRCARKISIQRLIMRKLSRRMLEEHAIGVINAAHTSSAEDASYLLHRQHKHYGDVTCMQLARIAHSEVRQIHVMRHLLPTYRHSSRRP